MNTLRKTRSIVVGIDDSTGSLAAMLWAASEARAPGAPLCFVHAYPDLTSPPVRGFIAPEDDLRAESVDILERGEKELSESGWHGEPPRRIIRKGNPDKVFREIADQARIVVVGRRGSGGFKDLLIGSAAYAVAEHARVPTVIVPERWTPAGGIGKRVVLGIDHTTGPGAIDFAFGAAAQSGQPLEIVHVCTYPVYPWVGWSYPTVVVRSAGLGDERVETERRWMAEQIAGCTEQYPDVLVEQVVRQGSAPGELLGESSEASLLVVGGKDHGTVHSVLIGSVARTLMHQATCPLAVVHAAG
jgi:nucleotide-binding universal stress UspA family protein